MTTTIDLKRELAESKAARDAVPLAPEGQRPKCRYCGNELRPYRWRTIKNPEAKYGGYGDNAFCGLRCGYHFALNALARSVYRP